MFSEILNYFVIPTMVSLGAFGVFYILNPDTANKVIKNVAWESVKMYSKASIYLENLAQSSSTDEDFIDNDNDDFEEIKPLLSYYDFDDGLEVQMGCDYETLPQEWWNVIEENVDLIILKNENPTELFKTFKNHKKFTSADNNNWDKVEKQFVQVELLQNEVCIDIHKYLDSFYINKNILFTPAFLKWYLQKWFNKTLNEDSYTLKIFDKDVNLFNLTPKQYITLTNDGYKIKNIDDESESEETEDDDESTSEYEGAQDD
tara:strand:+ start:713 stop:1492 length:780 start_codon:yes stop_codon:yes gene_type:complete